MNDYDYIDDHHLLQADLIFFTIDVRVPYFNLRHNSAE